MGDGEQARGRLVSLIRSLVKVMGAIMGTVVFVLLFLVLYLVWFLALRIALEILGGGWSSLLLIAGLVASIVLYLSAKDAFERRAARRTVERLLALAPASSWSDWALPAPESYALFSEATEAKRDALKLGLLQLIAMGVLTQDGSETGEHPGGDTTLRSGPTSADTLAGTLAAVHRLWAASAEDNVRKITDRVAECRVQEAKGSRFDCPECGKWLPGDLPLSWHRKAEHGAGQWIKGGSDV